MPEQIDAAQKRGSRGAGIVVSLVLGLLATLGLAPLAASQPERLSRAPEVGIGATAPTAAASAVAGLHRAFEVTALSTLRSQTLKVECEPKERVIGGGGSVSEDFEGMNPELRQRPALTELRPVHPAHGRDYYVVSGAWAVAGGIPVAWRVAGYATATDRTGT